MDSKRTWHIGGMSVTRSKQSTRWVKVFNCIEIQVNRVEENSDKLQLLNLAPSLKDLKQLESSHLYNKESFDTKSVW